MDIQKALLGLEVRVAEDLGEKCTRTYYTTLEALSDEVLQSFLQANTFISNADTSIIIYADNTELEIYKPNKVQAYLIKKQFPFAKPLVKVPASELSKLPYPKCYIHCLTAEDVGTSKCDSVCPQKFPPKQKPYEVQILDMILKELDVPNPKDEERKQILVKIAKLLQPGPAAS